MRLNEERSAVIVIRAWREAGSSPDEVVARITSGVGVARRGWEESTVAGEDEIVSAVRAWLGSIAVGGDAPVTDAG